MTITPTREYPIEGWASYKQVAGYFGASVNTIRRWVYEGIIPAPQKFKRSVRFQWALIRAARSSGGIRRRGR